MSLGLAVIIFAARKVDPVCDKLIAKVQVAKDFCMGLSKQTAMNRCESIDDDTQKQDCVRVFLPYAMSACLSYVNLDTLESETKDLCH